MITGVEQRFGDASAAATQVILSGHLLSPDEGTEPGSGEPPRFTFEPGEVTPVQFRELVAGSSFNLAGPVEDEATREVQDDGGRWEVWGRGDWSTFTGTEGDLELDGSVITSTLGTDYRRDRLLVGLALAYSSGAGTFRVEDGDAGDLSGSMLSVHPYVRLALRERLAVWSTLGFGALGELGLDPDGVPAIATDMGMLFGAFGAQGALLPADAAGGLQLTANADALLLTARADDADGLVRATANVVRLRLLLEAGVSDLSLLGGSLTPTIALGVRYDDGDAEVGAGMTVGGTLGYVLPAWGLGITANGQGLLLHRDAGFEEWTVGGALRFDPGAPGRGLALGLTPTWGSASTDARRLWTAPDASILAPAAVPRSSPATLRLEGSIDYGIDVPGGTITPFAGFSGSPVDGESADLAPGRAPANGVRLLPGGRGHPHGAVSRASRAHAGTVRQPAVPMTPPVGPRTVPAILIVDGGDSGARLAQSLRHIGYQVCGVAALVLSLHCSGTRCGWRHHRDADRVSGRVEGSRGRADEGGGAAPARRAGAGRCSTPPAMPSPARVALYRTLLVWWANCRDSGTRCGWRHHRDADRVSGPKEVEAEQMKAEVLRLRGEHAAGVRVDSAGRRWRHHGADPGRERHRKGVGGALLTRQQPSAWRRSGTSTDGATSRSSR